MKHAFSLDFVFYFVDSYSKVKSILLYHLKKNTNKLKPGFL